MATPRTPKPEAQAQAGNGPETVEDAVLVLAEPVPPEGAQDPVMVEVEAAPPESESPAPEKPAEVAQDTPPPPPPPARSGGGVIGLVFGGAIAAAAGFALSQAVPQGWPIGADATLSDRLATVEADLAALTAKVAELPAPVAPDFGPVETRLDALAARLATVEGAVKAAEDAIAALPAPVTSPDTTADLSPRLDALEGRLSAVESLPPGAVVQGGGDPAALDALRAEIEALRAEVQAPDGPAQSAVAEVTAAAEAAKAALAEATAGAATLKAEAEAAIQSGRTQAALGRLRAALESGLPFATAIADLQSGGAAVPEVLTTLAAEGIPTLASLQDRFPEAARRALEDSLRADLGDSAVERLGSFLRTQVGARSLEPREGTDPDAVLSRAEAALAEGRLADALAELAGLPDPGRAAMAGWMTEAQQRLDAAAAVDAVAAALGEG